MFTQFIQVSNTTVAILMMGRVGSVELAALGLGGSFMIFVFLVCLGVMMSLSPTIAQHFGAGRNEGIKSAFQQGLWLAAITSIAAFFLLREMGYLMYWIGVDLCHHPAGAGLSGSCGLVDAAVLLLSRVEISLRGHGTFPADAGDQRCHTSGCDRRQLGIDLRTLGPAASGVEGAAMNLVLVGTLNALGLLGFVLFGPRYRARRLFQFVSDARTRMSCFIETGRADRSDAGARLRFFQCDSLDDGENGSRLACGTPGRHQLCDRGLHDSGKRLSATMARVGQAIGQKDPVLACARGLLGLYLQFGIGDSINPANPRHTPVDSGYLFIRRRSSPGRITAVIRGRFFTDV